MSNRDISRRAFLQGGLIAGVGVTLAPLGSQAFAALFENQADRFRPALDGGQRPGPFP